MKLSEVLYQAEDKCS